MDGKKKQIGWAVYKRNTKNYGQCRSRNNETFGMRTFNWRYGRTISNMNIKIARIHEDYVTKTTIFSLMLLNGLLVLVAPNFSKLIEEMSKKI